MPDQRKPSTISHVLDGHDIARELSEVKDRRDISALLQSN